MRKKGSGTNANDCDLSATPFPLVGPPIGVCFVLVIARYIGSSSLPWSGQNIAGEGPVYDPETARATRILAIAVNGAGKAEGLDQEAPEEGGGALDPFRRLMVCPARATGRDFDGAKDGAVACLE